MKVSNQLKINVNKSNQYNQSNQKHTIYKVTVNDQTIYIGRTNDLDRRIKEHLRLFKKCLNEPKLNDKQLYQYCVANKISLSNEHFQPIKSIEGIVEAKRYEMFMILNAHFNNDPIQQTIPIIKDGW